MLNLRLAFRQLRKTPGFSMIVILTLALGIGATTAIFSIVEGVLLRPLPFSDPDRLVILGDHLRNGPNTPVTAREIDIYTQMTKAFSSLGGYITTSYELSGGVIPEEVNVTRFTASVFPTLGVNPMLGRVFTQQEEDTRQPLAVISDSLWLNRYQRDENILGQSINLDRKSYIIIGVMPRSFEFPLQAGHGNQTQVWVPLSLSAQELSDQQAGYWGYHMVARLREGVTLAQAANDADRVARQIMSGFPPTMSAIHIRGDVTRLNEQTVANVRPVLRTLFLAVAVVLLISCANVAGLLLVRAIRRRREYAVRLALGASSRAIIRESILEGLLLSTAGGLLGLGFSAIAIRTTLHLLPESMPRVDSISTNANVAIFTLVISLMIGILCGFAPAFAALRTNLTDILKQGNRTNTGTVSHSWFRSALVAAEIAVSLVLLTASGALLRSFQKMQAVDLGFRPDHVLVAGYQLPLRQYSTNDKVGTFHKEIVDRLSSKPGMTAVGMTNALPSTGVSALAAYTIEDQLAESWRLKFASFAATSGEYFRAMEIPLLDGRYFTASDNSSSPLVVIVNRSMAQHSWPGKRAIGKRMHVGNPQKGLPWATVVGVVADTKLGARDEPSDDQWYLPSQQPAILFGAAADMALTNSVGGFITLRSTLPPEQIIQTLRSTVAQVDPLLALQEVQPMDEVISNVEAPRRFNTDLVTGFAVGALLLAITGIYALVAFSVSMRTHEIAIRMALGAQRSGIARLVLISGAKIAAVGCVLGVLGSIGISRIINSFLFQVSGTDPIIYIAGVLIIMAMALLASALPARRAASADPMQALQSA